MLPLILLNASTSNEISLNDKGDRKYLLGLHFLLTVEQFSPWFIVDKFGYCATASVTFPRLNPPSPSQHVVVMYGTRLERRPT